MYIFLPDEKDGLLNLMKNVKMEQSLFKEQIKLNYEKIRLLSIPKFKFECDEMKLKQHMEKLGLTIPFDSRFCKDFTGIIQPDDEVVYVSDILQKSFVEIDEDGTKAAAVTWDEVDSGYGGSKRRKRGHDFVADHPFMFMIHEEFTDSILFVGTVINPL